MTFPGAGYDALPCEINSKVGFSQSTSMALLLTFQNTLLAAASTAKVTPSDCDEELLNRFLGTVRDTMGTKSVWSAQNVSGGVTPRSFGVDSSAPAYLSIAAGWGLLEEPQARAPENVTLSQ